MSFHSYSSLKLVIVWKNVPSINIHTDGSCLIYNCTKYIITTTSLERCNRYVASASLWLLPCKIFHPSAFSHMISKDCLNLTAGLCARSVLIWPGRTERLTSRSHCHSSRLCLVFILLNLFQTPSSSSFQSFYGSLLLL